MFFFVSSFCCCVVVCAKDDKKNQPASTGNIRNCGGKVITETALRGDIKFCVLKQARVSSWNEMLP